MARVLAEQDIRPGGSEPLRHLQFFGCAAIGRQRRVLRQKLQAYAELFAKMLHDDKRPCLYLAMVREPSMQEESCLAELRLFAKQNVDWLEGIVQNEDELGLPASMPARDLAEMIFASLEGMMAISLTETKPAAAFRRRANNFLKIVTNTAA